MPYLIIGYFVAAYLLNWWPFEEEWQGYVYPNRNDLTIDKYAGTYNTLEDCRAASLALLRSVSSLERGDYECGLNCKPEGMLNICEDTKR